MNFPIRTAADFMPLLPELVIAGGAFAILLMDLFLSTRTRIATHVLSLLTLGVAAALLLAGIGGHGTVLSAMFVRDTVADVLKVAILLVSAMGMVYMWGYLRERGQYQGEVSVLMLFATLGMMLLVSAGNLAMLYVSLEMLALCSYALVVADRDSPAGSEAGIKYFVLGALASGLLLYGMSLLYGGTGSLDLATISAKLTAAGSDPMLVTGVVFCVAGIAFKFGAAPFHMWLPDVYTGAAAPMTLFIGSAPKIAAFGMTYRLLEQGAGPLAAHWQMLLAGLAVLSLLFGNLSALMQSQMKRLLAFSTVSHVGFLFIGLAAGGKEGFSAAMFYAISYALMAAAGFGAVTLLSHRGYEADRLEDYRGLSQRSPWMALMILLVMVSMAGVPPFLGFWSKWAVLWAAINQGMLWLAIVGVIFAVIGAYYYLRVIKVMYFEAAPEAEPMQFRSDVAGRWLLTANAVGLLVLGIFFDPLMNWCRQAFGI